MSTIPQSPTVIITSLYLIISQLIQFMMTMASNSRNMKRSLPMIELGPSAKSRKPEPPTYTMRDPPNTDQLQQVEPRPPTHPITID